MRYISNIIHFVTIVVYSELCIPAHIQFAFVLRAWNLAEHLTWRNTFMEGTVLLSFSGRLSIEVFPRLHQDTAQSIFCCTSSNIHRLEVVTKCVEVLLCLVVIVRQAQLTTQFAVLLLLVVSPNSQDHPPPCSFQAGFPS